MGWQRRFETARYKVSIRDIAICCKTEGGVSGFFQILTDLHLKRSRSMIQKLGVENEPTRLEQMFRIPSNLLLCYIQGEMRGNFAGMNSDGQQSPSLG